MKAEEIRLLIANHNINQYPIEMKAEEIEIRSRTLNHWKKNAEEDFMGTPISVLKYITILEEALPIYAKDQIEKDRERVKKAYMKSDWKISFGEILRDTPIILD